MFIYPDRASPETTVRIRVKEGTLYRLQGHPAEALVHIVRARVSFSIRGWDISMIEPYHY